MRWTAPFIEALAGEDGESEVMLALVMATFYGAAYGAAVVSAVWWLLK